MKKLFLCSLLFLFAFAANVSALDFTYDSTVYQIVHEGPNDSEDPYDFGNSGNYLGTVLNANDSVGLLEATIQAVIGPTVFIDELYGKAEIEGDGSVSQDGPNEYPTAISHLSGYKETPVPEPATMLLLGSGLIGLADLGRKKFFKKADRIKGKTKHFHHELRAVGQQ